MLRYLKQPETIRSHAYAYTDASIASKLLQPYWIAVTNLFPKTVAPNVITALGFCCTWAAFLLIAVHDPTLMSSAPRWAYVACGLLVFAYQTLDAADGKQARRTGCSSPIGELWDHGTDAVSSSLLLIVLANAMQLGRNDMVLAMLCGVVGFYMEHWLAYWTGGLHFAAVNVPSEGLLAGMAALIMTGVVGPQVWLHRSSLVWGLSLNVFVFRCLIVPSVILMLVGNIWSVMQVLKGGASHLHAKHGHHTAAPYQLPEGGWKHAVATAAPLYVITLSAGSYYMFDATIVKMYPLLFFGTIAFMGAHFSNRITVVRMVREPMVPYDAVQAIIPVLLFAKIACWMSGFPISLFTEACIWSVALALAVMQHADYLISVIRDFQRVLGVPFWSVGSSRTI
jgi:phosphatidylglycerophosphate synthase